MKQINVRVSDTGDIIYYNDRPHVLDNLSFVRDEQHNCQLVVYATMSPVNPPELHLTPSFIDEIERQSQNFIGTCFTCKVGVTEADDYTSDDAHLYCSEDCYFERPLGVNCGHCKVAICYSDELCSVGGTHYCSDDCADNGKNH